jgi:hypothetical protein
VPNWAIRSFGSCIYAQRGDGITSEVARGVHNRTRSSENERGETNLSWMSA